ncbi:MAG TPA: DUF4437 domain-containing protein [Crenotrichaceae bacterium]|nr:DUF4437 domain-containing protein [Crenotrichaceae bacterium]
MSRDHFFPAIVVSSIFMMGCVNATTTTRTPVSQIDWITLPSGRKVAEVKGNMNQEAHIKLVKYAPGMKSSAHTHSASYTGFVLKGTARHYEPGKPDTETILPTGSFWKIPAEVIHISECLTGEECIFATISEGPFDIKFAK